MNKAQFEQDLLQQAQQNGLTQCEIYAEAATSLSISIYDGEVESYDTSDTNGVSFRALVDGKMGYAYTEKIDDDSIAFLIEAVKANASVLETTEAETIFTGSEVYHDGNYQRAQLDNIAPQQLIETLLAVEKAALAYDERIKRLTNCSVQLQVGSKAIRNSASLQLEEQGNVLYFVVGVLAQQDKETKSGFAIRVVEQLADLDINAFVAEAADKALSAFGGKTFASKRYPIILRNDAATALFAVFTGAFSAENVHKDLSRLKGKLGTKIATTSFTMLDDPHHKKSLSATNFDAEGVATKKRAIIESGVLQTYLHNRKTAAQDGVTTTANASRSYKSGIGIAPYNFTIQPGTKSYNELVATLDEGIIITSVTGLHAGANTISGDFSVAAQGFYVKAGKVQSAVRQMTIAGNFFELLLQIEDYANDLYYGFSRVTSPSLHIGQLAVTID